MNTVDITRKFEFDAGHRVLNHEGKCRNLHGHRYVLEVSVSAPQLDSLGRVIDFGDLKKILGEWIDREWDHNMVLNPDDPLLQVASPFRVIDLVGRSPFIMPAWAPNPTVENLVRVFGVKAQDLLAGTELRITKIRMYETPNCWADFIA